MNSVKLSKTFWMEKLYLFCAVESLCNTKPSVWPKYAVSLLGLWHCVSLVQSNFNFMPMCLLTWLNKTLVPVIRVNFVWGTRRILFFFLNKFNLGPVTTSCDLNATHYAPATKECKNIYIRVMGFIWDIRSSTRLPATRREIMSCVRCGNVVWSVRHSCSLLWCKCRGSKTALR